MARREFQGCLLPEQVEAARAQFESDGFIVLREAIPHELIDRARAEMDAVDADSDFVGFIKGSTVVPSRENQLHAKFRFKDMYINSETLREVIFAPQVMDAICAVSGGPMLAFQSLGFTHGSGLRIHNDSNFVSVDKPETVIGCWIALEDIDAGCGELLYYPGSHRFPVYTFGDGSAHKDRQREGVYAHEPYVQWLREQIAANNLPEEHFTARKGDCLIWHAHLVHAGSPVTRPDSTRYSVVTHLCALDAHPGYAAHCKFATPVKHRDNCYFSSRCYDTREISDSSQLCGRTLRPRGLAEHYVNPRQKP